MSSIEKWFVYTLFSPKYNRIYIGMTKRPNERLKEHNSGKMKSTKGYIPWTRVFKEKVGSRVEARKREKFYKTTTGRSIIRSIIEESFQ